MVAVTRPQDTPYSRFEFTTAAQNVDVLVDGAPFYRKFLVHIVGVQAAQQVDIKVSLDGTNFPVLLSNVGTTAAGAGLAFHFELHTPPRGGLKIAFSNNAADGKVLVQMGENPYYIARHQN